MIHSFKLQAYPVLCFTSTSVVTDVYLKLNFCCLSFCMYYVLSILWLYLLVWVLVNNTFEFLRFEGDVKYLSQYICSCVLLKKCLSCLVCSKGDIISFFVWLGWLWDDLKSYPTSLQCPSLLVLHMFGSFVCI